MQFTDSVQEYYDSNTARFLRWGADEGTANIHGALWPPGVKDLKTAMNYANHLVAAQIASTQRKVSSILDLGCGVGSSLIYIEEQQAGLDALYGISLSETQIDLATNNSKKDHRFHFLRGNFQQLPGHLPEVDFAYAIEAFYHSPDANVFFQQISQQLRPGGRLVLIDDCLTAKGASSAHLTKKEKNDLAVYRSHWLVGTLLQPTEIATLAGRHGFRLSKQQDLTPWLRLRRTRDRLTELALTLFSPLFDTTSYLRMLKGGVAKQHCFLRGLTTYRLLVLDKIKRDDERN